VTYNIEDEGREDGGAGVLDAAEQQFSPGFLLMLAVGRGQALQNVRRVRHKPHLLRKIRSVPKNTPVR